MMSQNDVSLERAADLSPLPGLDVGGARCVPGAYAAWLGTTAPTVAAGGFGRSLGVEPQGIPDVRSCPGLGQRPGVLLPMDPLSSTASRRGLLESRLSRTCPE